MTKTNNKFEASENSIFSSYWIILGCFKHPVLSLLQNLFARNLQLQHIFQGFTVCRYIPSKLLQNIWKERKKIFIRTIFWVVIGPCGSIYDQSKCRNLNTESVYFKHDISRDNAFCLIQKCNELCWIVTLTFLVRVKIRLKKTPEKHEVRPWTFVVTVLYSILLSYFI